MGHFSRGGVPSYVSDAMSCFSALYRPQVKGALLGNLYRPQVKGALLGNLNSVALFGHGTLRQSPQAFVVAKMCPANTFFLFVFLDFAIVTHAVATISARMNYTM